jgi:hypothetical protein
MDGLLKICQYVVVYVVASTSVFIFSLVYYMIFQKGGQEKHLWLSGLLIDPMENLGGSEA